MKKFSMLVIAVVVGIWMSGATDSIAATKTLPKGAKVSASVKSDRTADIKVTGVPDLEMIEYYAYGKPKVIKGAEVSVDIDREGRRFQVLFGGGFYAFLSPDMRDYPPDFFGPGVGLDCSNPGGCCFIITGK